MVRRRNHDGIKVEIRFQHFAVIPKGCGLLIFVGSALQVAVVHITQGDHVFMRHCGKIGRASVAHSNHAQAQSVGPEPWKISMAYKRHSASEQREFEGITSGEIGHLTQPTPLCSH